MMKAVRVVPGFLLFLMLSSFASSAQRDTIYWNAGYHLKWPDFDGTPDVTGGYVAETASGIDYAYWFTDTSFTYCVRSFFDRKGSWKKASQGEDVLQHEQLHFDITEVFARKLRKAFHEYAPTSGVNKQDIDRMVGKLRAERAQMQGAYDLDTNFGDNSAKQALWATRVHLLLEGLLSFAKERESIRIVAK